MIDWLRDPIWQFIGSILALLAIGVTIYIYVKSPSKKSMAYHIITETPLARINESFKDKVQILYNNEIIAEPYLLLVKIINSGNTPIASADFESPINIIFASKTIILDYEITESSPKNFKVKLINPSKNKSEETRLDIIPALWNSGDYVVIKLLLSQYDLGGIAIIARIAGINEISILNPGTIRPVWEAVKFTSVIFALVAAISSATIIIASLFIPITIDQIYQVLLSSFIAGCLFLLLLLLAIVIANKKTKLSG